MSPLTKIILLYFAHVGLIKIYFIIAHKIRGKIINPYYEELALSACSFMLGLVTTNIFFDGDEKYYLWVYLPIFFVGLILAATAIAKLYCYTNYSRE